MMDLRKDIFFVLFLLLVGLQLHAQPRKFKLRQLTGFYLDDKVPLTKGFNFMIITNRRSFIKHFGLINKPDTPNLQYNQVIVMAMPPTKEQWFLSFEDTAVRAGNYIEVYCNVRREKHDITYLDRPIVTASLPKFFSVRTINFYDNKTKKLLGTVPVK